MSPHSTRGHKCDLSQLRFLLRSFSSLAPNGEGEGFLRGYGRRLVLRITHVLWHKDGALLFPSGFQSVSLHSHCGISFLFPKAPSGLVLLLWGGEEGLYLPWAWKTTLLLGNSVRLPQAQKPKLTTAMLLRVSPPPGKGIRKLCTWTLLPKTIWALVFP